MRDDSSPGSASVTGRPDPLSGRLTLPFPEEAGLQSACWATCSDPVSVIAIWMAADVGEIAAGPVRIAGTSATTCPRSDEHWWAWGPVTWWAGVRGRPGVVRGWRRRAAAGARRRR